MMSNTGPTLCFPDAIKSCAACCPPIRPAAYEHIQYKNIVKRILRENTSSFAKRGQGIWPITGFSCWAMGYLDKRYRLVGCLLHPAQNSGVDFRYRVHYGEKCRRESCRESKVFLQLETSHRRFWLNLATGLDSFAYSSKKANPLFRMMGWGAELLNLIARGGDGRPFTRESFFLAYPFFSTTLEPLRNAYLLNKLVKIKSIDLLKSESFCAQFEEFSARLSASLRETLLSFCKTEAPYTHLLELDRHFLDFVRLSLGIARIGQEDAHRVKEIVDRAIEEFQETPMPRLSYFQSAKLLL